MAAPSLWAGTGPSMCVSDIAVPPIRTSLSGVWSSDVSELWLDILCGSLNNLPLE